MNQIDIIKRNIYALYKEHKAVHACIRLRHMKSSEQNSISVVITKEIDIQELDGTLPKSIDIKRPRPRKVY